MKRFFTLLFLFFVISTFGQNLIPDPSAENYIECPSSFGDLETWVPSWLSFRGSPDYFNSCSPGLGWNNDVGFQEPRTGEGYVGLFTFSRNLNNAREYLGIELVEPLVIGQKYFLTFYVSRAHQANTYNAASNNIGALLMVENYLDFNEQGATPNFSSFNEINLVEDTVNWVEMSYEFIADSAYAFLAFGNFFDDVLTDTMRVGGASSGEVRPYYYFDDFCLTTSSEGCDFTSSNKNFDKLEVALYPNPCKYQIIIEQKRPIELIEIYSLKGELLKRTSGEGKNNFRLHIDLPSGFYLLTIYSKEQKATKRFTVLN